MGLIKAVRFWLVNWLELLYMQDISYYRIWGKRMTQMLMHG